MNSLKKQLIKSHIEELKKQRVKLEERIKHIRVTMKGVDMRIRNKESLLE